jgi:hypothetical protein
MSDRQTIMHSGDAGTTSLGDIRDLVQAMSEWRRAEAKPAHLIILSLAGVLPEAKRPPALITQASAALVNVVGKRGGRAFRVSPSDGCILLEASHQVMVSVVRDLKVEILKVIERNFPGSFGTIDQTRLMVSYDLAANYTSASERISRYAALAQNGGNTSGKLRALSEDDLKTVMHAYRQIGAEKFITSFVRNQPVAQRTQGKSMQTVMNECFISIDSLRKPLFIDVELRGTGRMFDEFTLVLDQIMLRAFKRIDTGGTRWSINMNVESVFTRAFEHFLEEMPNDVLSQIIFEFRQPNIVENFDEFLVARSLIHSSGAKIAVDRIFPHTLGLVDLEYIGASIAKVHWRSDAEETFKQRERALRYLREGGVQPVLIRVDDAHALEVGTEHGITMFQGFLIDDMMKKAAA